MNRVILIGNGFDLAHGMKTRYKDFIDDFWEKEKQNVINGLVEECTDGFHFHYKYEDEFIYVISPCLISELHHSVNINGKGYNWFIDLVSSGITIMLNGVNVTFYVEFKNIFLKIITENATLQNWVDIEEEYYSALIDCQKNNGDIKKLNNDFSFIQNKLQNYLLEQNETKFTENTEIRHYFFSDFSKDDFIHAPFAEEFDKILFLNFNYTSTLLQYTYGTHDTKVINIHGELQNPNNPIIFGYGDEKDDNYKFIENKKNNDYLKYFKAFHYSRNNNYREVLKFINKNEYQIYIMGLSCGTSDRTLLNKLFEHNNCKSIKIFYHKERIEADNFLDIYMNISRNFTDKEKMRELIVSKENSLPLT